MSTGSLERPEQEWPDRLALNAWTGEEATEGGLASTGGRWAVEDHFVGRPEAHLAAPARAAYTDWRDPRVGWGLVLPDDSSLSDADRSRTDDAPEPIRRLAATRAGDSQPVVLRYKAGAQHRSLLYRYYLDSEMHALSCAGEGIRGTARGGLPYYLLLAGSPERLPWEVQFELNHTSYVGRLDLDEEGLGRYVEAALSDWADSRADPTSPLVWAGQHEAGDITWLMRQTVAEQVYRRWATDAQIGDRAGRLVQAKATNGGLADALAEAHSGVVVTTSHGMTGPLNDQQKMRRNLGLLVDSEHALLDPKALLRNWQPDGVVWYALACCSAGGSGRNQFTDLVDNNSRAYQVLDKVAALGPVSAQLPRALLGAARPARAFIGHVEPTFNWTLRRMDTGQITTDALVQALYNEFFQQEAPPVGFAFARWFQEASRLRAIWQAARSNIARGRESWRSRALRASLSGIDRQCTVILGDPAVAPAALPAR
jgi:hypothetical protein